MLFVCQKCGCVENTACGHYWGRERNCFGEDLIGLALCSECTPDHYIDGSPNPRGGKWHGRFTKELATPEVLDRIGRSNFYGLPQDPVVRTPKKGCQRQQPKRHSRKRK
jgi:hypothetical protein